MAGQDEVLIKIASDVSGALAGLNTLSEVMVKFADDMKKAGEKSAQSGEKAVAFGTLYAKAWGNFEDAAKSAVTALPNIISRSADAADSLLGLSKRTDVSVKALSGFQYVADQTGVSFQLLSRSIQTFGIQLAEGSEKTSRSLEGLHLSLTDLQSLKPEDAFVEVLKKLKEIPDAATRTAKGVELLGPKFRMMSNLATEDVDTLLKKANELGLTISDKFAKQSNDFNAAIGTMKAQMQSTKNSITEAFIGPLTDIIGLSPKVSGSLLLVGESVFEIGKKLMPVVTAMLPKLLEQYKTWGGVAKAAADATGILTAKTWLQETAQMAATAAKTANSGATGALAAAETIAARATGVFTAATERLFAVLMAHPFIAITAAVAALGVMLYQNAKHWREVGDAAEESAQRQIDAGKLLEVQAETAKKTAELAQLRKEEAEKNAPGQGAKPRLNAQGQDVGLLRQSRILQLETEISAMTKTTQKAGETLDNLRDKARKLGVDSNTITALGFNVKGLTRIVEEAEQAQSLGVLPMQAMAKATENLANKTSGARLHIEQLAASNKDLKQAMIDVVHSAASDEDIKDVLGDLKPEQMAALKGWVKELDTAAANTRKLDADQAALGKTGVAAAEAGIAATLAQAKAAAETSQMTGPEKTKAVAQAEAEAANSRAKLAIDTARSTAAATRQIETDRRIEEINENKKGLDAQLATIAARRDAEIASAKASGDAASVIAQKTREANQRADLDAQKARFASQEQLAAAAQAQQADFIQRDIAMQEEGAAKETALIEAKYQRQLELIVQNESDAEVIQTKADAARADRDKSREELRVQQAKSAAETILENARTYREQQIKDTEVGEQQLRDLREVDLERQIAGWKKTSASAAEIEEKIRAYHAETNRQVAQGNTETTNGLITRAKQYRKEYEDAIKNINLTDAQRLVLLKKAIDAEQQARHEQAHDTDELLKTELANATAARNAMETAAGVTDKQREEARRAEFDAMLAFEKNAKRRAELEVLYNKGFLERIKSSKEWSAEEIKAIEEVLKKHKEAANQTSIAWTKSATSLLQLGASITGLVAGWGEISSAIGGVATGIEGASAAMHTLTEEKKDGGGMSIGAIAGMATSWIGVAIAVAKVVVALIKAHKAANQTKNAMLDVSKEMGATISKGTAQQIQKDAEELKKLDKSLSDATARHYAELLKLQDIIKENGGLNNNNLEKWGTQAQRLFEVVARGGELGKKAEDELVAVMGDFADQAEATGGVWSDSLKKLMTDMKGTGIGVKEITDMISGQQDKLVKGAQGVTKALGTNAAKYAEIQERLAQARQDAEDDDSGEAGERVLSIQKELAAATVNSQGEFDRLSRIELAAFNTLVASGKTGVEAMREMGEGIDNLIAGSETFGLQGSEAFESLKRWRELTTENAPLLDQIGNLNDLMVASANLGSLTADAFGDLQTQGLSAFEQLTAAGLTQQEAETAMKPLLENIIKLHEERGYAIDEETQKIIDQATEDGVLSAQKEDAMKVQLDLMASLVTAVGGTLPDSYKKMAQAAIDANKKVTDSTKGTQDSVNGVQKGLEKTDWHGWAKEAVDAASKAQEAVDGVSLGHSPGGIKEIPIKLMESMKAFTAWQKVAVRAAEDVEGAVNDIAPDDHGQSIGEVASMMQKYDHARMTQERAGVVMGDITLAIDRPILKDRESIQELAVEVSKNLRKAVSPLGAWTN